MDHRSLKAYLAPTGLVSEPRGDLTCRGVEEPYAQIYNIYTGSIIAPTGRRVGTNRRPASGRLALIWWVDRETISIFFWI